MQQKLANLVLNKLLIIYPIESEDYPRLFELMAIYQDKPMDLADASLVLTAEKTQEKRILTIDSDFYTYRIDGKDSFNIIGT
jgi:predicted nucleic acid-binding protein